MLIERLQRLDGPAAIAILAVVVVFENKRAGAIGPFEEFEAPPKRHQRTGRKLMRRRNRDDAVIAPARGEILDAHPVVVHI